MKSLKTAKQYFALCLLTCSAAFADHVSDCSMQDSTMVSMPEFNGNWDEIATRAPRIPGPGNPPVTNVSDVVYGNFYITDNLFVKSTIEAGCSVGIGGCVDLSSCCNANVCEQPVTAQVLNIRGSVQAAGYQSLSDGRLKKDIALVDSMECLEAVMALKPKSYSFMEEMMSVYNLPQGRHMGFVAQDVESVMPQAVATSTLAIEDGIKDIKTINYQEMVPMLVGAVQQCAKEITQLRVEVARLKKQR